MTDIVCKNCNTDIALYRIFEHNAGKCVILCRQCDWKIVINECDCSNILMKNEFENKWH